MTIEDALGCLLPDGRTFVRARDRGMLRSLTDAETETFRTELRAHLVRQWALLGVSAPP